MVSRADFSRLGVKVSIPGDLQLDSMVSYSVLTRFTVSWTAWEEVVISARRHNYSNCQSRASETLISPITSCTGV